MGTPVTISTEVYTRLLKAEILLDMVVELVKGTDSKYSVDKEDLCRILNIKTEEDEEA